MAITQTNNVSGVITLASGGNTVGTVNVNNLSGHSVTTSISGQTVNLGSAVSISGQPVQTSVSGNVIPVYDGGLVAILTAALSGLSVISNPPSVSDPVVVMGQTQITYLSGGTQLPDFPCRSGLWYTNVSPGGVTYTGGLDENAPYWRDNSDDEKGMSYPQNRPDLPPIPCTNANQLRVVVAHTGVAMLTYMAFT